MVMFGWVPFFWGLAEAVFFFIVPDVWLTWVALHEPNPRLLRRPILLAVLGAVIGGCCMFFLGQGGAVIGVDLWLDRIPGISLKMIDNVHQEIADKGAMSLAWGMLRGIPYKIYAYQWGVFRGDLWKLVVMSVLVRGGRFIFGVMLARTIDGLVLRFSPAWQRRKRGVFICFWMAFYIFYFSIFP